METKEAQPAPKPSTTDRALAASDPTATVLGALLGMAGALGLLSRLGISADQAAELIGFLGAVAAGVRTILERGRQAE